MVIICNVMQVGLNVRRKMGYLQVQPSIKFKLNSAKE